MKRKSLVALMIAVPALALAVDVIDYAPSTVFTPVGFDSNDNVQVVLDGTYPNTCYKVSEPSVKVDKAAGRVDVYDKALYYKGAICLYMLVPYYKTVNLGVLPEGQYNVFVHDKNQGEIKAGSIGVSKATVATADDHLYAPVDEAIMDQTGPEPVLTLKGTFSQSCLRIKDVKVLSFTSPNSMIEVLPIAEEDGTVCRSAEKAFSTQVVVKNAPAGRTLLHIRSLNGAAINRVLNMN